jgi:hypothetical protein
MLFAATYESVKSVVCLSLKISILFLGIFNSGINEMRIGGLVGRSQDQRGVGRRILCKDRERMLSFESTATNLRLVGIDRCVFAASANLILKREAMVYIHSKSPESETTTVPVALSWSRELGMVVVE